ncbi:MAG: hypothetical protein ACXVP0_15515 [Bacteroidia bacterium]
MKKFYIIEPEVAGNITKSNFIDKTVIPPTIKNLVYTFDGWLGDDIIESILIFIVTEKLKENIEIKAFSGVSFDEVEIRASEQFKELNPNRSLPKFYWLKVHGIAGKDDFGCINKRLVISESVLKELEKFAIVHAEIEEYVI